MPDKFTVEYIQHIDVSISDRSKLRSQIKSLLKPLNRSQVLAFSSRIALRTGWILTQLKVKDKTKLDRFYYYWFRNIIATYSLQAIENIGDFVVDKSKIINKIVRNAADATKHLFHNSS